MRAGGGAGMGGPDQGEGAGGGCARSAEAFEEIAVFEL